MKRTQVMGGLLAAVAICCLAGFGTLWAAKGGKNSGPPVTPVNYGITYFGPLPGAANTLPRAMNNNADIVGFTQFGGQPHSFLYSFTSEAIVDLNTKFNDESLKVPDGTAIESADAFDGQTGWLVTNAADINDAGQILCDLTYYSGGTSQVTVAARYTPSSTNAAARLDFLESPAGGGPTASAMNNQGDIVGGGYLWTDAQPLNNDGWLVANALPHTSTNQNPSVGDDLNDDDGTGHIQVIGDNRRFTVNVNSLQVTDDFDLGSLFPHPKGGFPSKNYAMHINNRGDVAGMSREPWIGDQEAYRYLAKDGSLSGLGSYGDDISWPGGMNNYGDVAGTYETSTGEWRLFLYSDAFGGMTDLSAQFPGLVLANGGWGPGAINDYGEICGFMSDANDPRGFLLTPQP